MCKSYCWSGSRCSIGQPLLLTQTSWVLPPLSVGKMTLRLYGALNYSHGLSKGPSFGTGRGRRVQRPAATGTNRRYPTDEFRTFVRLPATVQPQRGRTQLKHSPENPGRSLISKVIRYSHRRRANPIDAGSTFCGAHPTRTTRILASIGEPNLNLSSETSRRAGLESVCILGHDDINDASRAISRASPSWFCRSELRSSFLRTTS